MKIRVVTPQDAHALASIYSVYVRETTVTFELVPPIPDQMLRRITSIHPRYPFIVCTDDADRVVGYAYAHPWKEKEAYSATWETTIYIDVAFCNRGIGKEMMHRLISLCRVSGCHALIACITAENSGSIRFHESLGFTRVSRFRQVGFKFNRYLDVVDLEMLL